MDGGARAVALWIVSSDDVSLMAGEACRARRARRAGRPLAVLHVNPLSSLAGGSIGPRLSLPVRIGPRWPGINGARRSESGLSRCVTAPRMQRREKADWGSVRIHGL